MSPLVPTARSLRGRERSYGPDLGLLLSGAAAGAVPAAAPGRGVRVSRPRFPHLPRLNWRRAQGGGRAVSLLPAAAAAAGTCGGRGKVSGGGAGARGRPGEGHPLTAVRRSLPSAAAMLSGRSGPGGAGRTGWAGEGRGLELTNLPGTDFSSAVGPGFGGIRSGYSCLIIIKQLQRDLLIRKRL